MKLISAFLILFILGSYWAPCSDEEQEYDLVQSGYLQIVTEGHAHDLDLCSPFCSCHCCHSHTFKPCMLCMGDLFFFEDIPSANPSGQLDRLVHAIWDPPRSLS